MPLQKLKENNLSTLLKAGTAYLERKRIPGPQREAELLLSRLLSLRRIDLYIASDRPITSEEEDLFWACLRRRGEREPLQYIFKEVAFFGMTLLVQQGVFIPRPETELIMEEAEKIAPPPARALDLCTGSGALALGLSKLFPSAGITAIDLSASALAVAEQNKARHQASGVTFLQGDLFEPLKADQAPFDLIVCNPPYIPERDRADLQPEVRDYEPALALFAPENGTAFYRRILREVPSYLAPQGALILELGRGQGAWLQAFVKEETVFTLRFTPDFAGIDRVAILRRGSGGAHG